MNADAATLQDAPVVHVVMATSGEWSDRVEWPLFALYSRGAAEREVENCTARVQRAIGMFPSSCPPADASDRVWENYDKKKSSALDTIIDIGISDFDVSFFIYDVPIKGAAPSSAEQTADATSGMPPTTGRTE